MNYELTILLLAIVPALLLWVYIYGRDRKKEPVRLLLKALLYGVLAVPLVFAIHFLLAWLGIDVQSNVFLRAFVSAALIEEGCKFYLLRKLIWRNPAFDERFDGIVYSVYVSLGFAIVENLLYLFVYTPETAFATGIQRALWAVPAHFLFAVIMGYYLSWAKFNPEHRKNFLFLSLFLAVLAHGGYDLLLMLAEVISTFSPALSGLIMVGFYVFDFMLWRIGLKRINRQQRIDELNNMKF